MKTTRFYGWRGETELETENETVAAQYQTLQTIYDATKLLQTETADADYVNNVMGQ